MRAWEHDEKLVASRQAKGQLMMGTDDIYYIQLPSKCQYLILCSFSLLCLFPGMPTQKVCNLVESYWFVFSAANLINDRKPLQREQRGTWAVCEVSYIC